MPPIPNDSEPPVAPGSASDPISQSGPIDPGSTQAFWDRTLRHGKMPPGKDQGRITDTGPEHPNQYDPYTFVGPQPRAPYGPKSSQYDPSMADPSMGRRVPYSGGMKTQPPVFATPEEPSPESVLHVSAEEPDEDNYIPLRKHLGGWGSLGAVNA